MPSKYYAVRNGREIGIFNTWNECKRLVTGFKGAEYKSFTSLSDAEEYIGRNSKKDAAITDISNIPEDTAVAYVDGSYNIHTKVFGFGAVIFHKNETHTHSQGFTDPELASMRNVAGEIRGAMYAMEYCVDNNIPKLQIFYDYAGIEKWCVGEWKCNKDGTIAYCDYYNSVKDKVDITFIKVKGHSGDKYNDMADSLAKQAAGVEEK